jgi:hypothetical protein
MKLDQLKKLIESNTDEEKGLDFDAVLNSINGETGSLIDRKVESAKTNAISNYEKQLFTEIGFEDKESLTGFVEKYKEVDLSQFETLQTDVDKYKNMMNIYKSGFQGDESDLDYIDHKVKTLMSQSEDLSYDEALSQFKQEKEYLFGTTQVSQTKVKPPKVSDVSDETAKLAAKYGVELD